MPEFDIQEINYSDHVRVDTDKGIIHDVKILGHNSKNGRTYKKGALEEAKDLYEGIELYLDHPDPKDATIERSLRESVGYARNIRVKDDGLYGDAHVLKTHPHGPSTLERAERFPDRFGLSQNARVQGQRRGGGQVVVESIRKVRSVDFVRNPATNINLFESESIMKTPLSEVIKGFPEGPEKTLALALQTEYADILEEAEVAVEDEMSADEKMSSAFEMMIVSAFNDPKLDTGAKISKFRDILKAQEKLMSSDESSASKPDDKGEEGKETSPADTQASESIEALESRISLYENKDKIRALAEKEKVTVDEEALEMCLALPEKHWGAFLKKQPAIADTLPQKKRPTYTGSVLEETKLDKPAENAEDMVKRLRRTV